MIGAKALFGGLAAACFAAGAPVLAQQVPGATAPQPGFTLSLAFGGGWTSNPIESTIRTKGDALIGHEITLARRWALWEGGAFALTAQGASEFYARSHGESYHRGLLSASLSQNWQGFFGNITVLQRKSMNRDFSAHDAASREIALGLGRNVALAEGWGLNLFARAARRFFEDGAEDQWRASINATLTHRRDKWIFRFGGGYSWTLEDKTPILPRINTRTVSARAAIAYEWVPDSEIALRLSYSRGFSSYQPDRWKAVSLVPQISTQWRF